MSIKCSVSNASIRNRSNTLIPNIQKLGMESWIKYQHLCVAKQCLILNHHVAFGMQNLLLARRIKEDL